MKLQRATINDVARQAGVSKATVSAVLNDTGAVSPSTRDRVLAAIDILNYRPSRAARTGRVDHHRPRALGLLIKELDNPYYAEIALGARAEASRAGYSLLVASSEGEYDAERRAVQLLQSMNVDGLIATPVLDEHADLSHFFELKRRNFPFVLLEEVLGVPASLVDIDNRDASRKAMAYLIAQGHVRIAHFAGPAYSLHSKQRVEGVRQACSASRLVFDDADVVPAGAHLADGYRAGLEYFRRCPAGRRPTAVTCYNDLVAIGVCRALAELGIRVPDDVSIVGCDDIPLVEYLSMPLTTMRIPRLEMGQRAAQLLIRRIEADGVMAPEKLVLDAELVVRRSTRALGADGGAAGTNGASRSRRRRAPS